MKLLNFKKVCSLILIICFLLTVSIPLSSGEVTHIDTILENIVSGIYDWDCSGITLCGIIYIPIISKIYLIWCYRHPALLIETVNEQYDSAILSIAGTARASALAELLSGATTTEDIGNLQFNETHIFGFDWDYMCDSDNSQSSGGSGGESSGEGSGGGMGGLAGDKKVLCVGKWGPMYPRSGMSIHHIDAVASALNVYRSLDIMLTKEKKEQREGSKRKTKDDSKTSEKVSEYLSEASLSICDTYCMPIEDDILKFYYLSEYDYIDWHTSLVESIRHFGKLVKSIRCIYAKDELIESKDKEKEKEEKKRSSRAVLGKPEQWKPEVTIDRLQLVYPGEGKCITIPQNPKDWIPKPLSKDGKYVWVWWRWVICIQELT